MDGAHHAELLFTLAIDRDIHAVFLQQIIDFDPQALHVVIQDQAGFHLPGNDSRLPKNLRLLPLPPYSPELNPVERFGGLLKARVNNRLYPSLRQLENHLFAASREWTQPAKVAGLIHRWLADQVDSDVPA
ncbi:MAG: transposase [Opitutaceae bacterium]|nr:transposase [Opitutaceae bacterium]